MDIDKRRKQKNEAQRRYKLSEKGKKTQQKYYTSDAKRATSKRYRQNKANSIKIQAHRIVEQAIKVGFLKKAPCETCGKEPAHAHHDDYNKPLEVRWLCTYHHTEYHRQNNNMV